MKPKSIQIQTIDFCNRKCRWCPNSTLEKPDGLYMDRAVYSKILDDLVSIDYEGKIHLYLMAEPLSDWRLPMLIREARDKFPDNIIFISTNGDYIHTREYVEILFKAGLSWMGISHYDDESDKLFEITKGMPDVVHTPLSTLRQTFYNRGGNCKVASIQTRASCDWLEDKAYVNYKGDVILCCSDYKYEVVFGNVTERSFNDIYNSPEYNTYRIFHKVGRARELNLCKKCNRIG